MGYISEYPHTWEAEQGNSSSSSGGSSSSSGGSRATPNGCSTGAGTGREAGAEGRAGRPVGDVGGNGAAGSHAGEVPLGDAGEVPPCADLFWRGINVERGRQRIIGQVWPKVSHPRWSCGVCRHDVG